MDRLEQEYDTLYKKFTLVGQRQFNYEQVKTLFAKIERLERKVDLEYWKCNSCGEYNHDNNQSCYNCSSSRN